MKRSILILYAILGLASLKAQPTTFEWAKKMGGPYSDLGYSVAVDLSGNIYSTGKFDATVDFDPGSAVFNLSANPSFVGIYVSKLESSGNFVWAKKIGESSYGSGNSIAVDASGNIYITGYFRGTVDFDPGPGIFNIISKGPTDIFISKLDASGNFVWAKSMGGASFDYGNSIALDLNGNIYTTGYFIDTADFDPGPSTYNLIAAGGNEEIFVSKLDTAGNFVWAKRMGGTFGDIGSSIAIDASANVYTTGSFGGTADFDPSASTFTLTSTGSIDIFISKLDASGNFAWAKKMGGTGYDIARSLAVDPSGNVYTTGRFEGTADFDPSASTRSLISNGLSDIFISKLDSMGNFAWAKSCGASANDEGFSIAADGSGNVYCTGSFIDATDFDPGAGSFILTPSNGVGSPEIFILKLDASGNFAWAKNIGGRESYLSLDKLRNVYLTGTFIGTSDFDPGAAKFNLVSAGGYDIFVFKMSQASVGIDEFSNSKAYHDLIKIYPNPTSGVFNITMSSSLANASLEIYNSRGILVYKKSGPDEINKIDLANYSDGLYFVKIIPEAGESRKGILSARILKTD